MLSQEMRSIHAAMGCLLSRVDPESAELVRMCRRNLEASAEVAENLEKTLIAPVDGRDCLMDRPPFTHEKTGRS